MVARASLTSRWAASGIGVEQRVRHPEAHRQRDEPGLGAVVEVALEAAELGRRVVQGVRAGLGQHGDPLLERLDVPVGEQPAVHRGPRPHDRLDPEPPQRPGDHEDEQQHAEQGQGEAHRAWPRAARPGRATSSGRRPSRRPVRPTPLRGGRYCGGSGVPSTRPAISRCRLATQRVAGMVSSSTGMPTTTIATAPKTAFRTNSTRAGTASSSCAPAYAVIRSRLGGGSAVPMGRILPDSRPVRGGAGTTTVGVLAPQTGRPRVSRMESVPFTPHRRRHVEHHLPQPAHRHPHARRPMERAPSLASDPRLARLRPRRRRPGRRRADRGHQGLGLPARRVGPGRRPGRPGEPRLTHDRERADHPGPRCLARLGRGALRRGGDPRGHARASRASSRSRRPSRTRTGRRCSSRCSWRATKRTPPHSRR